MQEAWVGVLAGLDRFEGRSSLKTWIFRILVDRAKTRGVQERRTVVCSSLVGDGAEARERDRFSSLEELTSPGRRQVHPPPLAELPEERVVAGELRQRVQAAIDTLAPRQRTVITLRDVEGWPAARDLRAAPVDRRQPARPAPPRALTRPRRPGALPR